MHGRGLTELLDLFARYGRRHGQEAPLVQRFTAFAAAHPDCLWRACAPGHITASAWIVSADHARCLLVHHKKLGKWLQPGGHVDGEERVELAALRETREESGMQHFTLLPQPGPVEALDLDVHEIPAYGGEGQHLHWDVRFLLRTAPGQEPACSDESHEVRWCTAAELRQLTQEVSVLRLHDKALRVLVSGGAAGLPGSGSEPGAGAGSS
jgi:8-oxo-dGTP pyrophosphatase MutT (NUDIX family)